MGKLIVISLGGSAVVPDGIDVGFLKKFRRLIISQIKKGSRFIIVVGGGMTARRYQKAASKVTKLSDDDIDWIGIHGTRINAHLLRTIFREYAHPRIINNPKEKNIKFKEKILVGAGWKPGWSTDYDAVWLAKNFGADTVINLTNIEYVYDSDPKKNKDAKSLPEISWKEYRNIVGDEWYPGLNAPFDPVASRVAQKSKMKVVIMKATNLKNLEDFLENKKYNGTLIS